MQSGGEKYVEENICKKYEIQNNKVYQKWKLVRVPKRIYCSNVSPLVAVSESTNECRFFLTGLRRIDNELSKTILRINSTT